MPVIIDTNADMAGITERFHQRAASRLRYFFVASLCVHAGLLIVLAEEPPAAYGTTTPTTLSVTLHLIEPAVAAASRPAVAPPAESTVAASRPAASVRRLEQLKRLARSSLHAAAAKPIAPPVEQRPRKPDREIASATDRSPPPVNELAPAPDATDATDAASVATPSVAERTAGTHAAPPQQAVARAQMRALLLADLGRRFTYPVLARRRGWQGEVLLSVTIHPSGMLERVQIAQSSGHDVLDRAAVSAMLHVKRVAEAGASLHGQDLQLLLPVIYRLTP